jgi:DNA ligase-1
MQRFAETCEAVAATASKKEKVRLVGEYLRSLPVEDAARAALFLTGLPFPRVGEEVLGVGGSLVWQAVSRLVDARAQTLEVVYRKHGDLGSMAEELLAGKKPPGSLSLADLEAAFNEISRQRGPATKMTLLGELLGRLSPVEAKYMIKIITGDLRIGLQEGLVEEAIAHAFEQPLAEVQRANMLTGDIKAVVRLAKQAKLGDARLSLFNPLAFMLATAAETAEEVMAYFPDGALVEDKYDGIRAQAHKRGQTTKVFSRTLDEVVEFSELLAPLRALPDEFILDGEIVAWREGRALPFTELQQRLGRKQAGLWHDVPVVFRGFDLLYYNQQVLLEAPLAERRKRLETLLPKAENSVIQLSPALFCRSAKEVQGAFEAALARGNEGIMAKAPGSPYRAGRRGHFWLKLKRPMATLDVVVTAVEYGHGKRRGLLSDYTFSVRDGKRLVTIGKAYSGLTDAEISQLTRFFKEHTVHDEGRRRVVEPVVVMEVAFNNMQRSDRHESGYALRFPRIVRLRPDKPVSEIDTLDRVKELFERQFRARG